MGGLRRFMPHTFWTFGAAWAAIVGFPLTAGFFSKDEILLKSFTTAIKSPVPGGKLGVGPGALELFQWPSWGPTFLYVVGAAAAVLTAFYMTRLVIGIFYGDFKGWAVVKGWEPAAGEHHHDEHHAHDEPLEGPAPKESPWQMTVPLMVLGVLSLGAGLFNAAPLHITPLDHWLEPVFAPATEGGAVVAVRSASSWEMTLLGIAVVLFLLGAGVAYWVYMMQKGEPTRQLRERFPGLYALVYDKWRIDELYEETIIGAVDSLAEFSVWFDKWVVDGIVARLTSFVVAVAGTGLRYVQTGRVQAYAAVMVVGVGGLGWFFVTPHAAATTTTNDATGAYSVTAAPGLGYSYRWDADGDGKWDSDKFGDQTDVKFQLNVDKKRTVRLEVKNAFGWVGERDFRFHRPRPDLSGVPATATAIDIQRGADGQLYGVPQGQPAPGNAVQGAPERAERAATDPARAGAGPRHPAAEPTARRRGAAAAPPRSRTAAGRCAMSPLAKGMFEMWPYLAALLIGIAVPRRKRWLERIAIGVVGMLAVTLIIGLWPGTSGGDGNPASEWPQLLNVIVFLPIVGAMAVLFMPRQAPKLLRRFTMALLLLDFVVSLWLLGVPMSMGWHFQYIRPWMPSFGIRYHVAVDGISVWLVLLTTLTTPIAAYVSFGSLKHKTKDLAFALLLLQGAMLGAFVSLDLFLFYVFWELMLVPMLVLIGVWGGVEKIKAAYKFFLYTMAGSVLMLAAILYLVWQHQQLAGYLTFDYLALQRLILPHTVAWLCFGAFALAFVDQGADVPAAHVAAGRTHAGTDGRLDHPGRGAAEARHLRLHPLLHGAVPGAGVERSAEPGRHRRGRRHPLRRAGGVEAGRREAAGRLLVGRAPRLLHARPVRRDAGRHRGRRSCRWSTTASRPARCSCSSASSTTAATRARCASSAASPRSCPSTPRSSSIVTMASIGVPGTNGFVGEFMVHHGHLRLRAARQASASCRPSAPLGVILAAVYMLGVVQKMFFGPLVEPEEQEAQATSPSARSVALAPLVVHDLRDRPLPLVVPRPHGAQRWTPSRDQLPGRVDGPTGHAADSTDGAARARRGGPLERAIPKAPESSNSRRRKPSRPAAEAAVLNGRTRSDELVFGLSPLLVVDSVFVALLPMLVEALGGLLLTLSEVFAKPRDAMRLGSRAGAGAR